MGRKTSDYKLVIEGIVYSLNKTKILSKAEVEQICKTILRGKTKKYLCDGSRYGKEKN